MYFCYYFNLRSSHFYLSINLSCWVQQWVSQDWKKVSLKGWVRIIAATARLLSSDPSRAPWEPQADCLSVCPDNFHRRSWLMHCPIPLEHSLPHYVPPSMSLKAYKAKTAKYLMYDKPKWWKEVDVTWCEIQLVYFMLCVVHGLWQWTMFQSKNEKAKRWYLGTF